MNRKIRMFCFGAALALGSVAHGQATEDPSGSNLPPASDWAAEKAEAEAQKAAYEAQAAAAKAQSAMYEAQLAAEKLKYGSVTGQSTISGDTTVGDNGAKPEAILLVNRSSRAAAVEIHDQVIGAILARPHQDLVILQGPASLSLTDAVLFDIKVSEAESLLDAANALFERAGGGDDKDAPPKSAADKGRSALTTAGVVVDSLAKLGSYFQSNYGFKEVKVDYDAAAVTYALAGRIGSGASGYKGRVYLPEIFAVADAEAIRIPLQRLNAKYAQVVSQQAASKFRAAALGQAGQPAAAARYTQAEAAAGKAITVHDSLMAMLAAGPATPEADPFIVRVLKQHRTRAALSHHPMVLVVQGKAAAQYYTKKNLWTFVGGPPLYTAGAVTATFVLTNPGTGQVLASGSVATHGGYRSIRAVEKLFP